MRSENFTNTGFPVDYLWMDIEHADNYQWFTFNPANFSTPDMTSMKAEIQNSSRRLVVIIDPHIKNQTGYFVYDGGMELQD